ncbi:hypothetical protein [Nocardioides insulae]|uniref:hypothetical protein n=1 Tax=Nocardioides insulae TaxID=394734 RepID=UPI00041BBBC8|nr:hypothetical protein [Nocardioides insulae]
MATSSLRARLTTAGTALASVLALAGCAGSVGGDDASAGDSGDGFAYGASQEEVDAAIEGLDPVEIVFQASAASPNSEIATSNIAFAEEVERRSGGQIDVEVLYGHPIAGYDEVYDALVDGRVDISYTNPIYDPDLFDGFDALTSITSSLPESPMAGELVAIAALTETAWNSEEIMGDFEAEGLVPLVPVNPPGAYFSLCNEPGNSLPDWKGRQVRIGSTVHSDLVSAMGGTPVSLEYVETYEALQRKTIDCTMIVMSAALEAGYFDIAPNLQYTGGMALPRNFGAMLAGSKYQSLPTAYQQIIFDAWQVSHYEGLVRVPTDNMNAVKQARAAGGEVAPFGDDVLETIETNREDAMAKAVDGGLLGEDIDTELAETIEKWQGIVSELGYEDGGSLTEMEDWFDPETFDAKPFVDRLYAEVVSKHRPS